MVKLKEIKWDDGLRVDYIRADGRKMQTYLFEVKKPSGRKDPTTTQADLDDVGSRSRWIRASARW